MARIPQYHRRIGFADLGCIYFDPDSQLPEYWAGRGRWKPGQALHTFVDDYRQEFFWRRPEEGLIVALSAGVCTAPDFTVWTDDPQEFRVYQGWRSATVSAYWQRAGVRVLPVVQFGTEIERYVMPGSAWAVRGSRDADWLDNINKFISLSQCRLLVVFGVPVDPASVGCKVHAVPLHSRREPAAQKELR